MTLTAGQRRWLDRQVGIDRIVVVDGTVVVDSNGTSVVDDLGGRARFPTDEAADLAGAGDPAAVRVEGEVTEWRERDGRAVLVIKGDLGTAVELVNPPLTPAEQRAVDEAAARQRAEDTERVEQDRAAVRANIERLPADLDPAVAALLIALVDAVFPPSAV